MYLQPKERLADGFAVDAIQERSDTPLTEHCLSIGKQLANFVVHFSIVHHYCQHQANDASV